MTDADRANAVEIAGITHELVDFLAGKLIELRRRRMDRDVHEIGLLVQGGHVIDLRLQNLIDKIIAAFHMQSAIPQSMIAASAMVTPHILTNVPNTFRIAVWSYALR